MIECSGLSSGMLPLCVALGPYSGPRWASSLPPSPIGQLDAPYQLFPCLGYHHTKPACHYLPVSCLMVKDNWLL